MYFIALLLTLWVTLAASSALTGKQVPATLNPKFPALRPATLADFKNFKQAPAVLKPRPQDRFFSADPPHINPKQSGTCSCGVRNPNGATRIVGGAQTNSGEIPWRVLIFIYDPSTGIGGLCGGTIISANWVMTAAHCTMDMAANKRINVYIGAQANPVTVGGSGTLVQAANYIQHPAFDRNSMENDITLMQLASPLTFTNTVSPACLPWTFPNTDISGANVLASGWGTLNPVPVGVENDDQSSSTLMEVTLPLLTTAQCQAIEQGISTNKLCTYNPGHDTCQGDSGGSIDYQNTNNLYYSLGVVSYGYGCAQTNFPGVYTKVMNYLPWIQSSTGENFCQI